MTDLIREYLITVEEVEGIWAEFGVYKGYTFKQLVELGQKKWKYVIGVDSFKGMAEPTEYDGGKYAKGYLNAGGCGKLKKDLGKKGFIKGLDYDLFEGYVPEILSELGSDWIYSFCYIDFDQYKPTQQVLQYLWSKVNKGGLILFDDYIERYNILATKAIKEFLQMHSHEIKLEEKGIQLMSGGCSSQMLIRKL
jgi:O-methyltransferase